MGDPVIDTPEWLRVGAVIVAREGLPYVAEITGFTNEGNPIVEYDSDGGIHDYWTCAEVALRFEPWREGMQTYDSTGKGRFENPAAWEK